MRQVLKYSEFGIVLLTIISFVGCGGGGEAAAPAGGDPAAAAAGMPTGGALPGDPAISDPTAGAGPAAANAGALPESGLPGDNYNSTPDGGAVITNIDPASQSTPGGFPGDGAIGLPGDAPPGQGFPGDAGGFAQAPPKDPAPPEDADLLTKANYAFSIGKEAIAHQYLYAHVLSNDAAAVELLKKLKWLWSVKRPVATTRFGVGIILTAPTTLTDYKPIGSSRLQGNQGGGGMDTGMPGGGGAGGRVSPNTRAFQDFTGDFGEAVIAAFESRWAAGDFGTAFNEVAAFRPPTAAVGGGFDGSGGFAGGEAAMPGGFVGGDPNATATPGSTRARALPGKSITPGLHYLGVGSQAELADKAGKEGLHAVFYFEVDCKPNRMGVVQNDTRIRLVTVGTNKTIAATQTLNNVKVERAMMSGTGNDVEKQVTSLMKRMESGKSPDGKDAPEITVKLVDLPKISAASAKTQVSRIVASKPKDVLAALTEVRLYHSLGLISDEDKSQAFQLLMDGAAGATLASGSEEERAALLKPKLASYK